MEGGIHGVEASGVKGENLFFVLLPSKLLRSRGTFLSLPPSLSPEGRHQQWVNRIECGILFRVQELGSVLISCFCEHDAFPGNLLPAPCVSSVPYFTRHHCDGYAVQALLRKTGGLCRPWGRHLTPTRGSSRTTTFCTFSEGEHQATVPFETSVSGL